MQTNQSHQRERLEKENHHRNHPKDKWKRIDAFPIPFFIIPVELDKIKVPYQSKDFKPTFESGLETTYRHQKVPDETYAYLRSVIAPAITSFGDPWSTMKFVDLWRNRYTKRDYQSAHIHPKVQWSFIIYEDVTSNTVFINPANDLIQNQSHVDTGPSNTVWKPKIEAGNMVLFPSWVSHMVVPGNEGHTIAGNIKLTDSSNLKRL